MLTFVVSVGDGTDIVTGNAYTASGRMNEKVNLMKREIDGLDSELA